VLRDHVATLATVEVCFNTEFVRYEDLHGQVYVTLRPVEGGAERTVEAAFLIGADGAKSSVREAIGARMLGRYGLSRNYNVVFRAPGLAEAHSQGAGIMYWQVNGDVPSVIGPMDRDDVWFFVPTGVAIHVCGRTERLPCLPNWHDSRVPTKVTVAVNRERFERKDV
jgi:2-polyprenyl-6-methoxyphenol hydroxylase-like FAD-dependent oxidoreductase